MDNGNNFVYDDIKCLENFLVTICSSEELLCVKRHFGTNNIKEKYF